MTILYVIAAAVLAGGVTTIRNLFKHKKLERQITNLGEQLTASQAEASAYRKAYKEEKKSHAQTIANYQRHVAALEKFEQDKQEVKDEAAAATASDADRLDFLHDYQL